MVNFARPIFPFADDVFSSVIMEYLASMKYSNEFSAQELPKAEHKL